MVVALLYYNNKIGNTTATNSYYKWFSEDRQWPQLLLAFFCVFFSFFFLSRTILKKTSHRVLYFTMYDIL